MNTSKQVNVMVGLLMVGAIATLLYFIWDPLRQDDATARQLMDDAERGAKLFSLNCSSCHGLTGKSALERGGLPGAVLNDESNRSTKLGDVAAKHARFLDTIRCGRVGTLMPPWSTEEGGSLNDHQIKQLVALITGTMPPQSGSAAADDIPPDPNAVSEHGWALALELANHAAAFNPPKELVKAPGKDDTTLTLNDATGLTLDGILRIDDDPTDSTYELVKVVGAPAGSVLAADASAEGTELSVQNASVFRPGDVLIVDDEVVVVKDAPAVTTLVSDVGGGDTTLAVKDASGFAAGQTVTVEQEKMTVTSVTGGSLRVERGAEKSKAAEHKAETKVIQATDKITVQRGAKDTKARNHLTKSAINEAGDTIQVARGVEGTKAVEHREGAEIFNGPIPPGTTITGQSGTPPCGQLQAAAPASPAAQASPVPISGAVAFELGDNFFQLNGQKNPTLTAKAGDKISVQLVNKGSNKHDMSIAGPDDKFGTDDDLISDPNAISGGASGTLTFTLQQARTYLYQCDFHPDVMKGEIIVTQ